MLILAQIVFPLLKSYSLSTSWGSPHVWSNRSLHALLESLSLLHRTGESREEVQQDILSWSAHCGAMDKVGGEIPTAH